MPKTWNLIRLIRRTQWISQNRLKRTWISLNPPMSQQNRWSWIQLPMSMIWLCNSMSKERLSPATSCHRPCLARSSHLFPCKVNSKSKNTQPNHFRSVARARKVWFLKLKNLKPSWIIRLRRLKKMSNSVRRSRRNCHTHQIRKK